jgi:hypothetical protein
LPSEVLEDVIELIEGRGERILLGVIPGDEGVDR